MDLRRMRDRAHYVQVLQVFDAFLAAWEPAVLAMLPAARREWLQARSRRRFLRLDLQALDAAAVPPPAVCLPPLPNAAAAWGSAYVMEGSALGGQVITRHLAEAGVPHASTGTAYFHGWGDATAPLWREFRGVLESELARPAALAQACAAACGTFDTLTHLLESALHERTPAA
jgi:heme oxygenase (biliverdin-IX-beta and delta-forming)